MADTIIVTGARSGLGLALIPALKQVGYTPVLTGRNADKVAAASADLGVAGYPLDVSDPEAIKTVTA